MTLTRTRIVAIFAGVFGNALEWYDFTVYAFFAPLLATLFFPNKNPYISLIMTFSVFAAGFLIRPLGAIFFGYIGDHMGRKKALIFSIILMSLPTTILAVLPNYSQIGIAAPFLLTLLRLLQGLAVSGEVTTAIAYLVEHAPANRRGLFGSFTMCSAFLGILISSIVAALISNTLTADQIAQWGWRLAFAIGGLTGFIGLFVRLSCHETTLYAANNDKIKDNTSVYSHLMNLNWKVIFLAILLTSVMSVGNYLLIAFFNVFLIKEVGLAAPKVTFINCVSLFAVTLLIPCMAMFSDRIGRKKILASGMIGFIILAYPIFWLLMTKNLTNAMIALLLYALILASITGLIPATLAELFETKNRNAALSIGYNVSLAVFGGTTPLVAMTLTHITHNPYSPSWYLIATALLSFISLFYISESHKRHLI